jgi:hypothetical protein
MQSTTLILVGFSMALFGGCERKQQAAAPRALADEQQEVSDLQSPGDVLPPPAESDEATTTQPATREATATTPAAELPAGSDDSIDDDEATAYFSNWLTPYGNWFQTADYGWCWQPSNYPPGWSPYTVGHWAYTDDCGWTWSSDEPFGWCCYHYGRWALLGDRGWCWVPGRLWGPAWVVWRNGNGLCGWAPLPPLRRGRLIRDEIAALSPFAFVFVNEKFIIDTGLREHFEPATRNVTLVNLTRDVTRFDRIDGRFFDRGVNVTQIERALGRPIPRVRLAQARDPKSVGLSGNELRVFRSSLPARRQGVTAERGARTAGARQQPSAGARFTPLQPAQPQTPQQLEARRREMEAFHQRLQNEMAERHRQEMQQPPAGITRERMQLQQQREQRAFEEMRRGAQPHPQPQRPPQPPPARGPAAAAAGRATCRRTACAAGAPTMTRTRLLRDGSREQISRA